MVKNQGQTFGPLNTYSAVYSISYESSYESRSIYQLHTKETQHLKKSSLILPSNHADKTLTSILFVDRTTNLKLPFWYLHHWAFMLLKHFLLYLSHVVDITHGINFWYTTAMNSKWTITQYFFASKRPGLGDRKHTTCLMKIISNHKPWEILYVHYSIYVYYTTLLDWRFLKHHYWTLRHQYVNPAATLLHKKKKTD